MAGGQAADRPGAGLVSPARLMVPVMGVTAGIQTLDPMISTVALVKAAHGLGFSATTLALAAGISTLALAATVIPTGLLADRLGRRLVLMTALVVAALGDVMAALSPGQWMFLTGRAVAGVGLGAVFGASFAFVSTIGKERLGAALGTFTALAAVTTVCGAFVGGALAAVSWRAAFCVVPAACLLALVIVGKVAPAVPRVSGHRPDYPGMLLLATGTVGILLGISNASASLASPRTWLPVLIGIAALALFTMVEGRLEFPAFPVSLFRNPVFVAASIAGLAWNFAQAATVLQLSNLWQYIGHYSTLSVTLGQLPFSVVAITSAVLAGRMLGQGRSPRQLLMITILLMAAGFGTLWFIRAGSGYLAFLPALALIGAGASGCSVPQAQLYVAQAPPDHIGPVTSSRLTTGQFGFAFGLAGSTVLISSLTFRGVTSKLIAAGVPPSQVGRGLDAVTSFVNTGQEPGTAAGRLALHGARFSYVHAFNTTMLLICVLMAAACVVCVLLLRPHRRDAGTGWDAADVADSQQVST
ncbi:MAG TPA: MFS transporter [Streptosporangiaceae bacterium]